MFITYALIIVISSCILIFYVGPRHGQTNPLIYVTITGTIGSLSVMGCKGLGVALKETISGRSELTNWLTWAVIAVVVVCITVQMNYLNKALDIFNTSVVTPILYVVFTTFVIMASAILFKEWQHLEMHDIVGTVCGFMTTVSGIFLLQAFKDMNVSLKNLPKARKADDNVVCTINEALPQHLKNGEPAAHTDLLQRMERIEAEMSGEVEMTDCYVHMKT